MEIPSFLLPANGVATPEQVARKRRLAEQLMGNGVDTSPVESPWQAVGRVGQAMIGGYTDYRAGQQEQAGQASAKEALAGLLADGSPDNVAIMGAMNNPWLTDGQGRIAGMLLEENFRKSRPDWQTFTDKASGDVYRWNQNDADAKPEMFFDAPAAPRDLETVSKGASIYDPNTGSWIAPPAPGGGPAAADLDDVAKVTKMYEGSPGISRYRTVVPSLTSMQKSLSDTSAISDLDFVYGVAKILDPESVVRESETGLVIQSQSIPDQVVGQLNKLLNGEAALTKGVRKDLFRLARRRGESLKEQAEREVQYFHNFGQGYGIAPDQFRPLDTLPYYDESMFPGDEPAPGSPQYPATRQGISGYYQKQIQPPRPDGNALRTKYGLKPRGQ